MAINTARKIQYGFRIVLDVDLSRGVVQTQSDLLLLHDAQQGLCARMPAMPVMGMGLKDWESFLNVFC